jgi:signal transduction histidine kinase
MVRGIGSFFEGKTAMSATMIGSSMATGSVIASPQQYKHQAHIEGERATQTVYDTRPNLASAHSSSLLNMTPPQQPSVQGQDTDERSIQPPDVGMMMQIDNSHSVSAKTSTVTPFTRSGASMLGTATGSLDEDPRDLQVKAIFERAANIIRESISVEGVIFLDASVGMFGGLIPSHQRDSNSTSSLDTDESSPDEASPERSTKELNCGLLGHSIAIGEGVEEEKMDPLRFVFKEKVLQTLLRRYPMGKIFNFDRDFLLQSGDSEEDKGSIPGLQDTERHTGRHRPKQRDRQPPLNEGETMSAAIPGARSVALVPLWDSHRERWFAGALAWTQAPARFFTAESELTYLRAFGMTIMTEVARIDAMHAEKIKSNLLGSLSHELRSPLHGIAASLELMQDTDLDTLQGDILHAMESCSRTLLDVIDHLLDYSDISKMVRLSKSRDKNARHNRGNADEKHQAFESLLTPIVSNVELDGLVEETAESVFAGYNHQKIPIAQLMQRGSLAREDINTFQRLEPLQAAESFGHLLEGAGGMQHTPSPIDVYLDIDPQASWFRYTRPGALRRIMMNILGNSLKYTKSGYIILSLRQEQMPGKNNSRRTNLKLTVTDTGRGMSEEFLQNRLYLPFAQEDALFPGTGLGLSIVHQLTKTIGGTIQVQSKVGRGTSICVTLPLPSSPPPLLQQSTFIKNVELLKNLRVRLRGLKESNTTSGLPNIAAPTEQNIIQKLCLDWLGMEVVSTESSHIRADLIICSDMALSTITSDGLHSTSCPVVVLCRDAVSAHNYSTANKASSETRIFEFISQP